MNGSASETVNQIRSDQTVTIDEIAEEVRSLMNLYSCNPARYDEDETCQCKVYPTSADQESNGNVEVVCSKRF